MRAPGLETPFRDTVSVKPGDLGTAAVRALEATPGVAEMGLAEAAREVPGHEPVDPSDVLFVRGGTADLKLVMLNGAPVFAPFHVGGLINALDTDLFRSATLYVGGAPARYDGGLAYVMDMETRSGRDSGLHGDMAVDMLAAKGMVEGRLAPGALFLASARGVHGLGATPFVGDPFPYSYGDAVSRLDVDLGGGRILSVTGFWNREAVRLDSLVRPDEVAAWGNGAGSIRLRTVMGETDWLFTLAVGDFQTTLPGGGLRVLLTEGTSRYLRAAADFGRTLGPGRLHFGASFDRLAYGQRVSTQVEDPALYSSSTAGNTAGAYIDVSADPASRLQLRGGLRADIYSVDPAVCLAPRVSATLLLNEHVALTVAAWRYRQYVRAAGETLATLPGAFDVYDETQKLTVATSSHLVATLDQDLGEGIRLSLQGFYKRFEDLPSTGGHRAEASGVDLWVRRSAGRLNGWFGYSLAWVWSGDNATAVTAANHVNDGRQLLTGGVTGPLIGKGKLELRVSRTARGCPSPRSRSPKRARRCSASASRTYPAYAMEPVPSVPNPPDQPYLRLDAQVARTFDADLGGLNFSLTPYIKVCDALNRRDGIFYYVDRGNTAQARPLAGLPVLPIIGFD